MSGTGDELKKRAFGIVEGVATAALVGLAAMMFSTREQVVRTNETLASMGEKLNVLPQVIERGIRNETEIRLLKERVADIEREKRQP